MYTVMEKTFKWAICRPSVYDMQHRQRVQPIQHVLIQTIGVWYAISTTCLICLTWYCTDDQCAILTIGNWSIVPDMYCTDHQCAICTMQLIQGVLMTALCFFVVDVATCWCWSVVLCSDRRDCGGRGRCVSSAGRHVRGHRKSDRRQASEGWGRVPYWRRLVHPRQHPDRRGQLNQDNSKFIDVILLLRREYEV